MPELDVTPLSTPLGAVVAGVDLAADVDDATVAGIRKALLDHKVLFFHDQRLDTVTQVTLARRFGETTEAHPVEPAVEGHPEVLALDSEEGARADVWHTDLTFQEEPPLGAILHAVEVPEVGGDTSGPTWPRPTTRSRRRCAASSTGSPPPTRRTRPAR